MSNPSYPNMPGQMPPGMGGGMGGPQGMGGPPGMGGMGGYPPGMPPGMGGPMGGMQMPPRTIRRGTSKAVPVVVSAGLAVGVFCGLLFGLGTGTEAAANTTSASNVKKVDETEAKADPGAAPKGLGATPAVETKTPPPTPTVATPAAGSAAPPAGAKPAAAVEKKMIKVKIAIKPEAAAKDAKITIDGKPIEGAMAELPPDTKTFKLEIKTNGYHSHEQKMTLPADTAEMNFDVELRKRATGGGVRPPKRPDRPTNAGGGGLIDI